MARDVKGLDPRALNILIYGIAGTGKSFCFSTYTKGRILLLQTEPGICSAFEDPSFEERAVVKRVTNWKELEKLRFGVDAWITWWNKLAKKEEDMTPIEGEFDLVGIDSLTWVNEFILDHVLQTYPPKQATGDWLLDRVPERHHWMMVRELLRQFLKGLFQDKIRIVVTAQAVVDDINSPGVSYKMWFPSLTGKEKSRAPHNADWVLWTHKKKDSYVVESTDDGSYYAKSRGVVLPKAAEFNLDFLFNALEKATGVKPETVSERKEE